MPNYVLGLGITRDFRTYIATASFKDVTPQSILMIDPVSRAVQARYPIELPVQYENYRGTLFFLITSYLEFYY